MWRHTRRRRRNGAKGLRRRCVTALKLGVWPGGGLRTAFVREFGSSSIRSDAGMAQLCGVACVRGVRGVSAGGGSWDSGNFVAASGNFGSFAPFRGHGAESQDPVRHGTLGREDGDETGLQPVPCLRQPAALSARVTALATGTWHLARRAVAHGDGDEPVPAIHCRPVLTAQEQFASVIRGGVRLPNPLAAAGREDRLGPGLWGVCLEGRSADTTLSPTPERQGGGSSIARRRRAVSSSFLRSIACWW